MKRIIIVIGMALVMALGASAQGRSQAHGMRGLPPTTFGPSSGHSQATVHSNGPRFSDRDRGRDRATDVGKGHKKGLNKLHKGKA